MTFNDQLLTPKAKTYHDIRKSGLSPRLLPRKPHLTVAIDALRVLEIAQEEVEEHRNNVQRRALRVFKDWCNPLEELNDVKFVRRYRISKESFRSMLDDVKFDLEHTTKRSRALLPLHQLSIALRFYACGSFQIVVGDTCGVSQATCCQVVHRVTAAICEKKDNFIHFPKIPMERHDVMRGFYDISQLPGIIGAIDGSHVLVVNPGGVTAQCFMNRKGYYSLNCQLVCNHLLLFTNMVCRWYGSVHDSRIFEESRLCRQFRRGEFKGILLGDPLDHNMAITVATVCLHNLAKRRNDPLPDEEDDGPGEEIEQPQEMNRVEADDSASSTFTADIYISY
ncbi:putative nuclease HARBI1 [Gigantopelta aegis]|uniref:putative nuclease HARBI1 n=1 Tax=Gigantopelta aegis TaxID=1735272 RepID=UPI001B88963A|nr:putative nuclease HARBI1 [Gigantopelta aegis]